MKMKKNLVNLILFSLIYSCGFKPIYKESRKLLDFQIEVVVKSLDEQKNEKDLLTNFLKQRLQTNSLKPSSLKLVAVVKKTVFSLGLQKDLSTTKYGIKYFVEFVFYDKRGIITKGTIERQSSYDIGESPYSNLIANETTSKNLLLNLADEIALLSLSLNNYRKIYP